MVSVGIVGAGFSGLCLAIQLQKAGLNDFTIFEAADDIGGYMACESLPRLCMSCAVSVAGIVNSHWVEAAGWQGCTRVTMWPQQVAQPEPLPM